jgi:hypothetical protein
LTHVAISNAIRREVDVADEDCGADVAAEDDGARMAMARTGAEYSCSCVAREGGRARASRRASVCAVNVARACGMT